MTLSGMFISMNTMTAGGKASYHILKSLPDPKVDHEICKSSDSELYKYPIHDWPTK